MATSFAFSVPLGSLAWLSRLPSWVVHLPPGRPSASTRHDHIVRHLVAGAHDDENESVIAEAAAEFAVMAAETTRLARLFERRGCIAFVDAQRHARDAFDKTDLSVAFGPRASRDRHLAPRGVHHRGGAFLARS
jgi:hypothetical protein